MPTVDFVSPGGAFTPAGIGDAQDLTTTFTIGSGSGTLTCNGASPFVSGDTGKAFNLVGAGAGGGVLSGTMTFVSSTQVTLSVHASTALSATSARLVWGTDNVPAIHAFNTWAQAQTSPITLTLGSGALKFFFNTQDTSQSRENSFGWGVKQPLTVSGNGPSSTILLGGAGGGAGLGTNFNIKSGSGFYDHSTIWTARLQTVLAGNSQLVCINAADAAMFANGEVALISGIDLQGFGNPPNPYYFEYVTISNVNTSTGVITLSAPLVNTYKSTWPNFAPGIPASQVDEGGPATLYSIDQNWVMNVTYQNFATDNSLGGGQTQYEGYQGAFINYKVLDGIGFAPSINNSISFTGCDFGPAEAEFDKLISSCIFDSCVGKIKFQSSGGPVTIRNGCNLSLNGTPRILTVTDSTIPNINVGPTSYGVSNSWSLSNVVMGATGFQYTPVGDNGDITGVFENDYPIPNNDGVIIRVIDGAVRWAVPGTICYFSLPTLDAGVQQGYGYGPSFLIKDMFDNHDGTLSLVTSLPAGYPLFGGPPGPGGIRVCPYPSVTAVTMSGSPQAINLGAATAAGFGGKPPQTYNLSSFNGATMGFISTGFVASISDSVVGRVQSIKVNVTTPYTGVNNPFSWSFGNFWGIDQLNPAIRTHWATSSIDMRTAGLRTITPAGVTGAVGLDAITPMPAANYWVGENFLITNLIGSQDIRAEYNANPAVGPLFTIEVVTDQSPFGLVALPPAVAPLRSRAHA